MAEVSGKDLVHIDQWPGPVDYKMSIPTNGFDSSREGSGNCVTAPLFRPGQKIATFNDSSTNPGWYTCIYLKFVEASDYAYDIDADPSSAHGLISQASNDMTQHMYDDTAMNCWWVTNDASNGCATLSSGRMFGLGMRDLSGGADSTAGGRTGEWGWFWCGGVCPCNTLASHGGTDYTQTGGQFTSDGSVQANCEIGVLDAGANGIRIGGYDFSLPLMPGPVGYSLAADA